jgi:hypothetical protein
MPNRSKAHIKFVFAHSKSPKAQVKFVFAHAKRDSAQVKQLYGKMAIDPPMATLRVSSIRNDRFIEHDSR